MTSRLPYSQVLRELHDNIGHVAVSLEYLPKRCPHAESKLEEARQALYEAHIMLGTHLEDCEHATNAYSRD